MRRLLFWLAGYLPLRLISDDGRPYLERYFVARVLGLQIYVHRFVGSDPVRGLHDHPWRWALSLVLAGHYQEETRQGIRRVRWVNTLVGDSFHRVILPRGQRDVWTLFIHRAGTAKTWGFLRPVHGEPARATYEVYTQSPAAGWWHHVPRGRTHPDRVPL
jgi:hypothetical protein